MERRTDDRSVVTGTKDRKSEDIGNDMAAADRNWFPKEIQRTPSGRVSWMGWLLVAVVLFMVVSHVAQLWLLIVPSGQFKALHLGLGLIVVFLMTAARTTEKLLKWTVLAMAIAALACVVYIFASFDALIEDRMFGPNGNDIFVGCTLLVLALTAAALSWGWIIPVLALVALAYGLFGYVFESDLFYHSGITFPRLISYTSIPFFQGLLGGMTGFSGSLIFVLMIFAGLLKSTGGIDFILTISSRLSGKSAGGPAKVAVLGSGMMGMISGSTVANVASTGAITIPLMKKNGFEPEQAGAVEAVASTGGQFMPPIMGLTAFLIVGMTGISYPTVMAAALIPALIYYGNLLIAVHFSAVSAGLRGIRSGDEAASQLRLGAQVRQYAHLIAGLIILVYLLMIQVPPAHAGITASAFIVVTEFGKQLYLHRFAPMDGARATSRRILSGLYDGVWNGAQIAVVIAVIGIIVDMMTITGFAQKLSNMILALADSSLWVLLLLAALSCLVFGLGMPTPAAYSIVAVLGAPALVGFGIDLLAAHMFVFFYANMSAITPPVALAALVASKIANGEYFRTALNATRLGLPGFILPMLFIVSPELLMLEGGWPERGFVFIAVLMLFVALNAGLAGSAFAPGMPAINRVVLVCAAGLMAWPSVTTRVAGFALALVVFAIEYRRARTHRSAQAPVQENA